LPSTAIGAGRVDVEAFWRRLGNPVLCADDRETWVLGAGADDRNAAHAVRPAREESPARHLGDVVILVPHRSGSPRASLYGMANVPRAVWIDEHGRIVRPPETAGSTDHFRNMDPETLTMSPADQAARDAGKAFYVNAVKEWVTTGRYALDATAARDKMPRITADVALAHAHFRLGVWLRRPGRGSGHACRRWATSRTTNLQTCPASRPRVSGEPG
jgi:hypothetical protein